MQIISETVWEAIVHRIVSRTKHHPAELGVLLPAGAHHTELPYRARGGFGGLVRLFSGASTGEADDVGGPGLVVVGIAPSVIK